MKFKICSKCKLEKSLIDNFYRLKDKYFSSYCKDCQKEFNKNNPNQKSVKRKYTRSALRENQGNEKYRLLLERFRDSDRLYQSNKRKTDKSYREVIIRYEEKYPERVKANTKVSYAIKMGILKRQGCEVCGEVKSHAHHKDYRKTLDVTWLCSVHHKLEHSKSNK